MRFTRTLSYISKNGTNLAGWIQEECNKQIAAFKGGEVAWRSQVNADLAIWDTEPHLSLVQAALLVWTALGRPTGVDGWPNKPMEVKDYLKGMPDDQLKAWLQDWNARSAGSAKPKVDLRSLPFNVQTTRKYQPVAKAGEIPSPKQWIVKTHGSTYPRRGLLKHIDDGLEAYAKEKDPTDLGGWNRLALLGELYFATDQFLKIAADHRKAKKYHHDLNREAQVQQLFVTIVDKLCEAFDCTVNVLPQMLEECWGRVLTPHGAHLDKLKAWSKGGDKDKKIPQGGLPVFADYLTRVQADAWRLQFKGGVAYMRNPKKPAKWVLANSAGLAGIYAGVGAGPMMFPGHAGFALSMGREIYMAKHKGSFDRNNFFHSSYLAGDPVQCTGEIKILNGMVTDFNNRSGHYRPTVEHLANVARTLKMRGCNLTRINVFAMKGSYYENQPLTDDWEPTAQGLLDYCGTGKALRNRIEANQQNIGTRVGPQPRYPAQKPPPPLPSRPAPRRAPPKPPGRRPPHPGARRLPGM